MSLAYLPLPSGEFPNDNPVLTHGARWVCRRTVGAAKAHVTPGVAREALPPREPASPPAAEMPRPPEPFRYVGPLDLDPGRIVLPQRVDDVPPPPAFVLEPFRFLPDEGEAREAAEPDGARGAECASSVPSGSVEVLPCVSLPAPGGLAPVDPDVVEPGSAPPGDHEAIDRAIAELDAAFSEPSRET